jgi:hypothetical protein
MINDKVKIGIGSVEMSEENVPVYELIVDPVTKQVQLDADKAAMPKVIGGVKGGSNGIITGNPIKVARSAIVGGNAGVSLGGRDYVNLIPIYFEYYKKTAWVLQDHCKIVGEYGRSEPTRDLR